MTTCIEKERVTSQKFKLMKLWNWLAYYALMAPYKSLAWIVKFKILPGAPFSKGPKANVKIKTCRIVARFLAHKTVNFASLTDSYTTSLF